jgi:predicted Zn-dependent protease
MYDAAWDPMGHVAAMEQLAKRGVALRHGAPTFYSTHPRDPDRIAADKKLIEFPAEGEAGDGQRAFQGTQEEVLSRDNFVTLIVRVSGSGFLDCGI